VEGLHGVAEVALRQLQSRHVTGIHQAEFGRRGGVDQATKQALYAGKVSMKTWSPAQVARRIRQVFTQAPAEAVAIAQCQSFLDPLYILSNTNGTRDWGVFQISDMTLQKLGGTPAKALNPAWNIEAAWKLWKMHKGFSDWPFCVQAYRAGASTQP